MSKSLNFDNQKQPPVQLLSSSDLERCLQAVGDELVAAGAEAKLIVVGGAALVLRGDVVRPTGDVDVLARVERGELLVPAPLSPSLQSAISRVAEGYGLEPGWINTAVSSDWRHRWPDGLPPGLDRVAWRSYGTLVVGLAGRETLIPMKLHAVLDLGAVPTFDASGNVTSATVKLIGYDLRHLNDLRDLAPSDLELDAAAAWVRGQDVGDVEPQLQAVLARVRAERT